MQFVLWIQGERGQDWRDLDGMRTELAALSNVLDALTPGQTVSIKRVS